MISNNDSCSNNDRVRVNANTRTESGSLKRRLRNKTSASSGTAPGLAGNQHLSALVTQNVLPVQGRRRVSNGFDSTRGGGSNHKNMQTLNRPQTRGSSQQQQQQQLLLAQQLPQVSITLIKNPDAADIGRSEYEEATRAQAHAQSGVRRQMPNAVAVAGKASQKRPANAIRPSSNTPSSKKPQPIQVQVTPSNPTASQRNFMNNLPYMGELTFDSRPRRGRKPKKADICHLISKNYGIQFPKCLPNNVGAKALVASGNKPGSSSSSPSLPLSLPLPLPLPPSLPLSHHHPKKRKLPQTQMPDLAPTPNSALHDLYATASAMRAPGGQFTSRSSATAPPSLITLQKLYQEKFAGLQLEFPNLRDRPQFFEEPQPLNLCTRDADLEVDVDAEAELEDMDNEDENELHEYNNNSIRNWLGTGMNVEEVCYDNAKPNKMPKPKTIITKEVAAAHAEYDGEEDEEMMEDEMVGQPGGNEDDGQDDGTEMLIGDDDLPLQYAENADERQDTKPPKFSSFLVKNHFLCSNNDEDEDDEACQTGNGREAHADDLPVQVVERVTKRTRRRRHVLRQPQERSLSLIKPSGAEPGPPGQNWTYHHHHLVPSQGSGPKPKPKCRGRDSKTRKRARPERKESQPTPANNAAVSAAVAASNNAQVSICKFKFTGGVKPTLQEKKMLSLDSGGNFRFYTDKPLQSPSSAAGAGGGGGSGGSGMGVFPGSPASHSQTHLSTSSVGNKGKSSASQRSSLKQNKGHNKVETKVSSCGSVTTTTSLLSLPKSAKSMSMCMLPTGSSSSVPMPTAIPVAVASASAFACTSSPSSNKSILSPLILPDITISACNSNSNSPQPDPDNCSSIKSSCCNSSCYSSSRASSPSRSCCSNSSDVEDGESASVNSSLLQVPSPLQQQQHPSSSLSSSAARRPHTNAANNNSSSSSRRHPHGHHSGSSDVNSRRRTKKSMARENLEKTFKEKGFLIQTQQLESSEGVTYCKFRQLKKFTRYLFRSWKDYLPENVKDSIVISGGGGGSGGAGGNQHQHPGRQNMLALATQELEGESVQNDGENADESDKEMCDDQAQDLDQEEAEIDV